MLYREVTQPLPGPKAFEQTGDAAVLTQAAFLLVLGLQLRGDKGDVKLAETLPQEDLSVLEVPPLASASGRIDSARVRGFLASRYGIGTEIAGEEVPLRRDVFADLALNHFREPTASTATNLMEACLRHPHEIVRVSAAAAYHDRSSEPERLSAILVAGTFSIDLLVRELAATALAQVVPDHLRLLQLQMMRGRAVGGAGADTTMLVHGTFARHVNWWQPNGDFHSYVRQVVRSDLYNHQDRFEWSGGYTEDARTLGAEDLLHWVNRHNEQGIDLITHSHGGSVAMLASNHGLRIGELVLLSCPVHPRYQPDFSRVQKVVSIRVRLDLVILLDRGGQKFKLKQIRENVLPIWFDHTATHNPDVWKNGTYNVPSML